MHHISMSGLGRALRCAHWAHESTPLDRRAGQAATDGTDDHGLLERGLADGLRPDDPPWLIQAMQSLGEHSRSGPPSRYHTEMAVAYDPVFGTGMALPKSGHRDYSACEWGIPGTIDLWWLEVEDLGDDELRTLVVRDWKTGPDAEESTDLPENSSQLACCALALLAVDGPMADEGIHHVRLEMALTGPTRTVPTVWKHETTPAELEQRWREQFARALQRAEADEPEPPVPGPHCKWCPATTACPEARSSLAAVEHVSAQDVEAVLTSPIRSIEHAAQVRLRIRLAEELLDRVKGSLKDFVRANGDLPLGDGKVLRLQERTRTSVAYGKLTDELKEAAQACGAVSVSMYDDLREGNAEPRKRARKAKAA